jgi:broad specificity phosphatase PhoE
MAEIFLIRHGQASFGKADYDQLSEKGYAQAKQLGASWLNHAKPSIWLSGSMKRHQQTAQSFFEGAGLPRTAFEIDDGFNEFDHLQVLHRLKPEWEERTVMAKALAEHAHPASAFQRYFEEAVVRWVSGEFDEEYTETWSSFRDRTLAAFQRVVDRLQVNGESPQAKRTVIFTSGGPIGAIVGEVLNLSIKDTFAINSVLANTSVTKLLSSKQRTSLSYLNNYSHLQRGTEQMVTYR